MAICALSAGQRSVSTSGRSWWYPDRGRYTGLGRAGTCCTGATKPDGSPSTGRPSSASDGTIYIAALDYENAFAGPLYALTPAGEVRWRYWPRDPIVADATLGPDGLLYVHLQSHYVQALDPASGELVQVHSGGHPGYTPVIDQHGTLYIGAKNDGLFAQPTAYGGTSWAFRTAGYVYASVLCDRTDTVYAGSDGRFMGGDGRLYAISLEARSGGPARSTRACGFRRSSGRLRPS